MKFPRNEFKLSADNETDKPNRNRNRDERNPDKVNVNARLNHLSYRNISLQLLERIIALIKFLSDKKTSDEVKISEILAACNIEA